MAIWVVGGSFERALLMRAPPEGGDAPLFDMTEGERIEQWSSGCGKLPNSAAVSRGKMAEIAIDEYKSTQY